MESENILNLYTDLVNTIQVAQRNKRANKDNFNLFSGLVGKHTHLEKYHSNFLAYLLGPENDHDCDKDFLRTFLEMIREKIKFKHSNDHHAIIFITDWLKDDLAGHSVIKEKIVGSGRVDIEISKNYGQRKIFIENKIRSTEGKDQLLTYFNHYQALPNCTFLGIYLTKHGDLPESIKNHTQANESLISLSYHDILGWLSSCIEKEFKNCDNVNFPIKHYISELKKELGMNNNIIIESLRNTLDNDPNRLKMIIEHQKTINDTMTQIIIDKRSFFLKALLNHIITELSTHRELFTVQNVKISEKGGTININSRSNLVEFSLYIEYSFPYTVDGGKGLWWGIYNIHDNTPFRGLNFKKKHWEGMQLNDQINDFEDDVAGSLLIIESESFEEKRQELLDYISSNIIDNLKDIKAS